MPNLSRIDVDYVSELTRRAGQLVKDMRQQITVSEKTGPRDLVTQADLACSKLIVDALRQRFPLDAIISEEDNIHPDALGHRRVWLIDPIDGTENYIANDGMYSVMIGLLIHNRPVYGWVYKPTSDELYVSALHEGVTKFIGDARIYLPFVEANINSDNVRLMMGNRDREAYEWVGELPGVNLVLSGSVGLRVAMIIEGSADVYLHLSGKLKFWDTAAPLAMAHAAGLEAGSIDFNNVPYPLSEMCMHEFPIVIGLPGSLSWLRKTLGDRWRRPRQAAAVKS
jgi:3'(2'), 5'-bisphosphate nucleotidase